MRCARVKLRPRGSCHLARDNRGRAKALAIAAYVPRIGGTHGSLSKLFAAARALALILFICAANGNDAAFADDPPPPPSKSSIVGDTVTNPITNQPTKVTKLIVDPAGTPTQGTTAFVQTEDGFTFLVKEVGEFFYNNDIPPLAFEIESISGGKAYVSTSTEEDGQVKNISFDVGLATSEFEAYFNSSESDGGVTPRVDDVAEDGVKQVEYGHNGKNGRNGALFVPPTSGGRGEDGPNVTKELSIDVKATSKIGWEIGSVGGNGGRGGNSYVGFFGGRDGGDGGRGGNVVATQTSSSTIQTSGADHYGIFAYSRSGKAGDGGSGYVAPGGGTGGHSSDGGDVRVNQYGKIYTKGLNAHGIYALSVSNNGGNGGDQWGLVGEAGSGGYGGSGGKVEVYTFDGAQILTEGDYAHGIFAQSIGGSGGSAGNSGNLLVSLIGHPDNGGNGGKVIVEHGGAIETHGVASRGIFAQSIGGGGGAGGMAVGVVALALGGVGSNGGSGDEVKVTNKATGRITTHGALADGIMAQSIGGSGGEGADAYGLVSVGGNGSKGGDGKAVTVSNYGYIETQGDGARGIIAQSIGGGGGDGGSTGGMVAVGGRGGAGGSGSTVSVTNDGVIKTSGRDAMGILAQSIGGGGGNGGSAGSIGAFVGVGIGGVAGNGGAGGAVNVTLSNTDATYSSTIVTAGDRSTGVLAQSIGGGGGNGGGAVGVSVGPFGAASIAVGGSGGKGGDGGTVTLTGSGNTSIETGGADAAGILLQSVGGGGGNGGYAISAAASGGPISGALAIGVGGSGSDGGRGGEVRVGTLDANGNLVAPGFSGSLLTQGDRSAGMIFQSVGGGGGNGGLAVAASASGAPGFAGNVSVGVGGSAGGGGAGGRVRVYTNANVTTLGESSVGLLAQSVGGGGGNGGGNIAAGLAVGGTAATINVGVGGSGGSGGTGGAVELIADGSVETFGRFSAGVIAQSIGGGGGNGGYSVAAGAAGLGSRAGAVDVSVGGSGGSGGAGGTVNVRIGAAVETKGHDSVGILIQSVGGGGGNGGFAVATGLAGAGTGAGAISVGLGGSGEHGGAGGEVNATIDGSVHTRGDRSAGVIAQSIGGGGGNGGFTVSGGLSGAGAGAGSVSVGLGGAGSGGGSAGKVTATANGTILTEGFASAGFVAQSIGGGGGSGGFTVSADLSFAGSGTGSVTVGLGGSGAGGGDGGAVVAKTTKKVETRGDSSIGVLAQSVGGGGGNGGFNIAPSIAGAGAGSGSISVGIGGTGAGGGHGDTVDLVVEDDVVTHGAHSAAVVAQSIGGGGGSGGFDVTIAGTGAGKGAGSIGVGLGGRSGSGGNANKVTSNVSGNLTTNGDGSTGLLVQSVGGGGGNGGLNLSAEIASSKAGTGGVSVGLGGSGGSGGHSGDVEATLTGDVVTKGKDSTGVVVQSLGGGGGNGALNISGTITGAASGSANLSVGIGGSGGNGGQAGSATSSIAGDVQTWADNSGGVLVQSVGGGGGNGGINISGAVSLTGEGSGAVGIGVGGFGGSGGKASTATSTITGDVETHGADSFGVLVQSVGGGGGNGAINISGALSYAGKGTGAAALGVGGFGSDGGEAADVTSKFAGTTTTSGSRSAGLVAQSLGGGGGNGAVNVSGAVSLAKEFSGAFSIGVGGFGGKGGKAGSVTHTIEGYVQTAGADSVGVLTQSVGGGGGNGGLNISGDIALFRETNTAVALGVGGFGGSGADAGALIESKITGGVLTLGDRSSAVLTQSVGGGGGNGGLNVSGAIDISKEGGGAVAIGVGGFGGGGGKAGDVKSTILATEEHNSITTVGRESIAILAQSVGGGGGSGGLTVNGSVNLTGKSGAAVSLGVGGFGGGGGAAGNVALDITADVQTFGDRSHGIFAQSVGGGGGVGGINISGSLSLAKPEGSATKLSIAAGVGGFGGDGGDGGAVSVSYKGELIALPRTVHEDQTITVNEKGGADGLVAQSIGGGGGSGGINVSAGLTISSKPSAGQPESKSYAMLIGVGGFGGKGGNAGEVDVKVLQGSTIHAHGTGRSGVLAQSVGGGGGNGGLNVSGGIVSDTSLIVGVGGMTDKGGSAKSVSVQTRADITVTTDPADFAIPSDEKAFEEKLREVLGNTIVDGLDGILESRNLKTLFVDLGLFEGDDNPPETQGSAGILAQSIGGGGGNGGLNVSGGVAISKDGKIPSITFGIGGFGGDGNVAGNVSVNHEGNIGVEGSWKHGIFAQSVAGGGGNGAVNVSGQLNWGSSEATGGKTDLSIVAGLGGHGGEGANAGNVSVVSSGNIYTRGYHARGIFAQSVGGGGGTGGINVTAIGAKDNSPLGLGVGGFGKGGGNAGNVTVQHGTEAEKTKEIITDGIGAHGIEASSIGGGGGDAGVNAVVGLSRTSGSGGGSGEVPKEPVHDNVDPSVVSDITESIDEADTRAGGGSGANKPLNTAVIAIGGSAGSAGDGGKVDVTHFGIIGTKQDSSYGIFAQSVGGGGGNANVNLGLIFQTGQASQNHGLALAVGGGSGSGGQGGDVSVQHRGEVYTFGNDAYGIFAQSIGGGGGNAGFTWVKPDDDTASIGIAVGGVGSEGGSAGKVTITASGNVITLGSRSHALFAQSIGGGGGNSSSISLSLTKPKDGQTAGDNFALRVGLEGAEGGEGGDVKVVSGKGLLLTAGEEAHAIFAQSIGGGGGTGGGVDGSVAKGSSYSLNIGGTGGKGGVGGQVEARNEADIITGGARSIGILAQSVGGAGGTGGYVKGGTGIIDFIKDIAAGSQVGTTVSINVGGRGGEGMRSGDVTVVNEGTITTNGDYAHGIMAQTVGGGGGMGGLVETKVIGLRASTPNVADLSIGGFGEDGADAGRVNVTNKNIIQTNGRAAIGIFAQAVGGGGGDAQQVRNVFLGSNANNTTKNGLLIGGEGGDGGRGGDVTVLNETGARIITEGAESHGIFAQSVGGGGGNGGDVLSLSLLKPGTAAKAEHSFKIGIGGTGGDGGTGGTVTVTNSGEIFTSGDRAHGIFAQSVGGTGGNGGYAITGTAVLRRTGSSSDPDIALNIGGMGGNGNAGGDVIVTNTGTILVSGAQSYGVFAQSVGGGGGNGGLAVALSLNHLAEQAIGKSYSKIAIGGVRGEGGDGGNVTVNHTGTIYVQGSNSYGIFAQSVAGGGGNAGFSISTPAVMAADYAFSALIGAIDGAKGKAGTVTVNSSGDIIVSGTGSRAIFGQNVNGGGGNVQISLDFTRPGENVEEEVTPETDEEIAQVRIAAFSNTEFRKIISVASELHLGSEDADGSAGEEVSQNHKGDLGTEGTFSTGVLLQSIGGGGGTTTATVVSAANTDVAVTAMLGAINTDDASGGQIKGSREGNVITSDAFSAGGLVQSIGGGGGYLALSGGDGTASAEVSLGADPSYRNDGGSIELELKGWITTEKNNSTGYIIQSIGGGGGATDFAELDYAKVTLGARDGSSGDGGAIHVTNNGDVTTSGARSHGFVLQSIGGGGGFVSTDLASANIEVELSSDNAGDGGDITFINVGNIITYGAESVGVLAQSVGGGGGVVDGAFRGTAGGQGKGGAINLDLQGNIYALGEHSIAVMAQSVGGNGGENIHILLDGVIIGGSEESANSLFAAMASTTTSPAAIFLDGGVENTVTLSNNSFLFALNNRIISGGAGSDSIILYGRALGNIDLGDGTNEVTVAQGASFYAQDHVNLGSDGVFRIDGDLYLGGEAYLPSGTLTPETKASDFAVTGNVSQTTYVSGSIVFGPTATYTADIYFRQNGSEGSDLIIASGNATVDGTLKPVLHLLERAQPLTLIHAGGKTTNNGLEIIGTPVISYQIGLNEDGSIKLIPEVDYRMTGMNRNQTLAAEHMARVLEGQGSAKMGPVFAVIANMEDQDQITYAVDQLASQDYAATQVDAFYAGQRFVRTMADCGHANFAAKIGDNRTCYWVAGSGSSLKRDGSFEFRDFETKSFGFSGGIRAPVAEDLYFGIGIGFDDFSLTSGDLFSAEGHRGEMALSVSKYSGPWEFYGILSGSTARYDTTRLIDIFGYLPGGTPVIGGIANAEQRVHQANIRLGTGYRYRPNGSSFYLRPALDLDATYLRSDDASERNTVYGLELRDTGQWVLSATPSLELGVDLLTDSELRMQAYLRGEVSFANKDDIYVNATFAGASLSDGTFRNYSEIGDVTRRLDAGLTISDKDETTRATFGYQGQWSKDTVGHAGSVSFAIRF